MPSYGLIVEGEADQIAFGHLIRKVNSPQATIYPLVCGGVQRLMKEFPILLTRFEYAHNGGPVDGALVIRDCDNKAPAQVLESMRGKLDPQRYRFPRGIELCVIRRTLDSWLLADEDALNAVSQSRRGRRIARVNETIEDIDHPKERLQRVLTDAKLNYTSTVLGAIAAQINLDRLEYRVPSFGPFKRSVLQIYGQ